MFDRPVEGIVYSLINVWHLVAIGLADLTDLSDLPTLVVADAQTLEVAFFVEIVDGLHGDLVRRRPVGTVKVPHVNLIGLELLERLHEVLAKHLRCVAKRVVPSCWNLQ